MPLENVHITIALNDEASYFAQSYLKETSSAQMSVSMDCLPSANWQDASSDPIDLIAVSLESLPFIMPDGWVKCAVLPRMDPGYSICLNGSDPSSPIIAELRRPLSVNYCDDQVKVQCAERFPQWKAADPSEPSEADLLPTRHVTTLKENVRYFHFDPMELIPTPAAGVICLIGRKGDRESRELARQWMDRETAMCSNLERGILQLKEEQQVKGELFAFSRKTEAGYEIAAALHREGRWTRCLKTLSTTAGAPGLIWDELIRED